MVSANIKVENEYGVFTLEELNKAYLECRRYIKSYKDEIVELKKHISELESELSVKEDLLKIKNGLCDEEPLPFSCDEYTDALFEELEDLRERHQQDCKTINQLRTTIDTLVDRYAKLREMRGLGDNE